jgi:hypothetical protein
MKSHLISKVPSAAINDFGLSKIQIHFDPLSKNARFAGSTSEKSGEI